MGLMRYIGVLVVFPHSLVGLLPLGPPSVVKTRTDTDMTCRRTNYCNDPQYVRLRLYKVGVDNNTVTGPVGRFYL
jgi:hypothetical protein